MRCDKVVIEPKSGSPGICVWREPNKNERTYRCRSSANQAKAVDSATTAHLLPQHLLDLDRRPASPRGANIARVHICKAEPAAAADPPQRPIAVRYAGPRLLRVELAGLDSQQDAPRR